PEVVAPRQEITAPTHTQEVVVENSVFRATITSAGARLKQLELKDYRTAAPKDAPPVTLVESGPDRLATLRTGGLDGFDIPVDLPYALDFKENHVKLAAGESRTLTFLAPLPNGLMVEKVFTFHGDRYDFELQLRLLNQSESSRSGILAVSLVEPWSEAREGKNYEFVGASTLVGEKLHQDDVDDLGKGREYGPGVVWTGFGNRYFLSAIIPLGTAAEKVRLEMADSLILSHVFTPYQTIAPGGMAEYRYLFYFGPKDLDVLQGVGNQMTEIVDFGIFAIIAKPLLHSLKFFNGFLHNYGLAIILLTMIIKLIFWPLTQKSYSSMKNMQKLQPEMQKIREKFKGDRERLNKEIMELYKKHRVNPLGGCLPMVVQIPVFFALYKVLMESIEVRHAPFYFWIQDLAAKDPYYITPIIMGATMFIQQKMTPTTMDPTQAKLFMLMPVIFTFMFLNFPSGLVLYWLVNNLLTIGQQALINRKP
ncbi:MAG: membrane protein insertase YidC, partial [Desulfuromonadales bacterium]|nr:membrane protein insertase YidC [Desulfuromonadales bacterium]